MENSMYLSEYLRGSRSLPMYDDFAFRALLRLKLVTEDQISNAKFAIDGIETGLQKGYGPINAVTAAKIMTTAVESVGLEKLSQHVDINAFWQNMGGLLAQNELDRIRGIQGYGENEESFRLFETTLIGAVVPSGHEANAAEQLEIGFANRINQEQGVTYKGNCQIEECLPTLQDVTQKAAETMKDKVPWNPISHGDPQDFWEEIEHLKAQIESGYLSGQEADEITNALTRILEDASKSPHFGFIQEVLSFEYDAKCDFWKREAEIEQQEIEFDGPSFNGD